MTDEYMIDLDEATTLDNDDEVLVTTDVATIPDSKFAKWSTIKSTLKTYFDTLYTGLDIHTLTSKTTPVDADEFVITDSASSYANKKMTFANLKATIGALLGAMITGFTSKTTPVDADEILLSDSASSNASKKVTLTNLKAFLKTYFDSLYVLAAGTYTPTLTNVTNIASSTLNADFIYARILSVVIVVGSVRLDPTTAATSTQLGISLPIASNFSTSYDCNGNASCPSEYVGSIIGDDTNDRAVMYITPISASLQYWRLMFMYRII